MQAQIAPRRPTGKGGWSTALGWAVKKTPQQVVFWHDGGTGGYMSSMGLDPKAGVGVVLLTNSITPGGGDDISWHILTGAPLDDPPVAH